MTDYGIRYVYHSPRQQHLRGCVGVWRTPSGGEVEGTEVCDLPPAERLKSGPDDLVYVGPAVGHMVRRRVTDPEVYRLSPLNSGSTPSSASLDRMLCMIDLLSGGVRPDLAVKASHGTDRGAN